ncbi:MAG TPA: helix-turn-helix transcriptional regulator [Demequina sp.]|nr:helix-turn-helix transcriptional regulator [Demequina sp.]
MVYHSNSELLRSVMSFTGTTQVVLSRISGVHQPTISQMLSGKRGMSDRMLERLLGCMGHRPEVVRDSTLVDMNRSERRSWLLHRHLSTTMNIGTFREWKTTIQRNLDHLSTGTSGQPHERNLHTWRSLVDSGDIEGIRRILTGVDRDSIEMREVSPMNGLIHESERQDILMAA